MLPANEGVKMFKDLRVQIDQSIVESKAIQGVFPSGGRELSLVVTKLQEAKMWCGKVLEELGNELPVEYQDKYKKPEDVR